MSNCQPVDTMDPGVLGYTDIGSRALSHFLPGFRFGSFTFSDCLAGSSYFWELVFLKALFQDFLARSMEL
jgi:hypothetical protein